MPPLPRCATALLALGLGAGASAAQQGPPPPDVTLTARDGSLELAGRLVAHDGAVYRIDTIYGLLTFAAEDVVCAGPGCPEATGAVPELRFAGSPTIGAALVPALVADYGAALGLSVQPGPNPGAPSPLVLADPGGGTAAARVTLALSSSDGGLLALLTGAADAALSLNPLEDPEVFARVLALDAFVPLVGADNPVRRIALSELAGVLAGEIDSWAALGGEDVPITLHVRASASGVQQALEARVLAPLGLPLAPGAVQHDSPGALEAAVAVDRTALGVGLWSRSGAVRRLVLTDDCGTDLPASAGTIAAGDYPLALPMLLLTPAGRLPHHLRGLIAHAQTPDGQAAIRATGLVDQGPAPLAAVPPPGLEGAVRLSTTVRFEPGTAEPDLAGRGAIALLARALEAGMPEGAALVFAGFTDASGPAEANLQLAQERAEAVLAAVRAAAGRLAPGSVAMQAVGFGATRPLACEVSPEGRALNRRVEVWLRPAAP